jgi:G3E family GTPase
VQDGRLFVVQGVRNIYDMNEARMNGQEQISEAKLVLIGRGIDQLAFQESLLATLSRA